MSDIRPSYDDEIDLLSLFETLWDAKWLISVVTFLFALVGLTFSMIASKSYEVSTPIDHARFSVFVEYTPLNDILIANGFYMNQFNAGLNVETNSGYFIKSESVFEMFLTEFNDYEEIVSVLQNDADVLQLLGNIQDSDRNLEIFKLAKFFKIVPPAKPEGEWIASFEWHDGDQGKILFSAAIQKALENVKQTILTDVSKLALSLDEKNARKLEQLQVKLSLVSGSADLKADSHLQYLKEQSAIAKELGIETNQLGANGLAQSDSNVVSLNVSSAEVPFYLRGFKAIDKEIALVESRTDEQVLILQSGYRETIDEIARIKSDLQSSQLRNALKLVESSNPSNWVDVNLLSAEIESKISLTLIVSLSVVLGGMISIIYVLVSSAIHARKVVKGGIDQSITI